MQIDCSSEIIVLVIGIASTMLFPFMIEEPLLFRIQSYPISLHVIGGARFDVGEGER